MAVSAKVITDNLRDRFVEKIADFFWDETEVLQTASGTLYLPTLDETGAERWIKISVIVPKASEEEGTDGYSLAAEYKAKLAEKAEKKAKAEKEKAAKIAKDAARREAKKKEEEAE